MREPGKDTSSVELETDTFESVTMWDARETMPPRVWVEQQLGKDTVMQCANMETPCWFDSC